MKELKTPCYIELSHWGKTIRITFDHHDLNTEEMYYGIKNLLRGAGCSEEQVKQILNEEDEMD